MKRAKQSKVDSQEAMTKLKSLDTGKMYAKLLGTMSKVDTKSKETQENEKTMTDSEGRKITYILTEDMIKEYKKGRKS